MTKNEPILDDFFKQIKKADRASSPEFIMPSAPTPEPNRQWICAVIAMTALLLVFIFYCMPQKQSPPPMPNKVDKLCDAILDAEVELQLNDRHSPSDSLPSF